MKTVLIADSGSTKTDWALVCEGRPVSIVSTQGINPYHQEGDVITRIIRQELCPHIDVPIDAVRFYGSGVRAEQRSRMAELLGDVFPTAADVIADSDLAGAAKALCGHDEGIACILGTGANSCLFDGEKIVANTPAMGYILGDEGSGAVLGARLLNSLYKGKLPTWIKESFEHETGLTLDRVIDSVYRQPMPNRFLASLAKWVGKHIAEPSIERLVTMHFRDFVVSNISPYARPDLPISAVGSIAFFFQDQLAEAATAEGYALGLVMRSPMTGLIEMEQLG